MLIQYLPSLIMFVITVSFASLFFTPTLIFRQKNKLVNFYWVGFWLFLVAITSLSGAQNTLAMAGFNNPGVSEPILASVLAAFVGFIFFGWFRLAGHLITGFVSIRCQ